MNCKVSLCIVGRIKMNIGAWMCGVLVIPFAIVGLLFGLLKEKATKFVAGFISHMFLHLIWRFQLLLSGVFCFLRIHI